MGLEPLKAAMRLTEQNGDERDMSNTEATATTLQAEIYQWSRDTFGAPIEQVLLKMEHEHSELQEEAQSYAEGMAKQYTMDHGARHAEIAKEAADVTFMLMQLAEIVGFDLIEETRKKFNINKARKWKLMPDGVYQHVKE